MANGRLIFSTVPVGQDENHNHILTVHVSPQLGEASPSALQNWANDVKSGLVQFSIVSPELPSALPAVLNTGLIHPDLWISFFGKALGAKASTAAHRAAPKKIDIRGAKVNLRDALNNATDFYKSYTNKIDVTDAKNVEQLRLAAVALATQNSIYALSSVAGPKVTVRSYLQQNLGTNLAATRIFGNVNLDTAFPATSKVMINDDVSKQIDGLHTGKNPPPLRNAKGQHVLHHIHRLRSVSRKTPANVASASLNATTTVKGVASTTMSFAEQIVLLQGMPVLMEAFGLVLVFSIDASVALTAIQTLQTQVTYGGSSSSYSGLDLVTPWTAVDGTQFLPRPTPAPGNATVNPMIRADNGYIDASADYEMGSLQLESASSHVFHFSNQAALRLNVHNTPETGYRAVTKQFSEDYTHVILPHSAHTDGLYVYQHDRQNKIRAKLAARAITPVVTSKSVLYAEDLFHSFAVDMKSPKEDWTRLTVRDEKYFRCDHPNDFLLTAQSREHGVRTSATRPTDSIPTLKSHESDEGQKHQIDETLFTWRRGSLAIKDSSATPMRKQSKETLSSQIIPWVKEYCAGFQLPHNVTIPEPRFGQLYLFAMRPIYVTGRARPFELAAAVSSIVPNPQPLLRHEVVLGPRLIKKAGTGSKLGDTQELMFVSSRVKNPQDVLAGNQMSHLKVSPVIEHSVRYLVPAATTAAVARRHGMSERAIEAGAMTVPLIKGKTRKGDGALPDTLPVRRGDIDTTTIYIPDPICDGVRATLFFIGNAPLPNQKQQLSKSLPFYSKSAKWPDYILHCLELRRGDPGSLPTLTIEDRAFNINGDPVPSGGEFKTIACSLPPGMSAVLELTPTILNSERDVLAFKPTDPDSSGKIPKLEDSNVCRPTVLRLAHASDVPVGIPDCTLEGAVPVPDNKKQKQKKTAGERVFTFDRKTFPTPSVTTIYEPYTTGKVSIEASWTEWVDDPKKTAPARLGTRAALFTRQLPKLQQSKTAVNIGSAYATDHSCPAPVPPPTTPCPTPKFPFDDSRYRRVHLAVTGDSRYGNIIPPAADAVPATREVIYEFLSIAPPPVPDVEYLMPTFEWQFNDKSKLKVQTRKTGLAVMLNRSWFASGDGEQLAVLLPPPSAGAAKSPSSSSVALPSQYPPLAGSNSPYGMESQVSAWGTHAVWGSVEDNKMKINLEHADRQTVALSNDRSVDIAVFDPIFDEVEQRWYCNLSFSAPPVYGALIRLVLARFQRNSIPYAQLSDFVTSDFAILNPSRTLKVKRSGSSLEVTVSGVGAYDPQGNLLTRFEVTLAKEDRNRDYDFPWREADSLASVTRNAKSPILWQGSLKYDSFSTNSVIVREYEVFPAFEAPLPPVAPGKAADVVSRQRLVYVSSVEIPPLW